MKNRILLLFTLITLAAQVYAQDSCGIIWSPPVELSSSGLTPRIAVQGETVHVTWKSGYQIPYIRSTNGGYDWDEVRDLRTDTTQLPYWERISASGSYLFLFWRNVDLQTNEFTTGWKISTDGGNTWSDSYRLQDSILLDEMSTNRRRVQAVGRNGGRKIQRASYFFHLRRYWLQHTKENNNGTSG